MEIFIGFIILKPFFRLEYLIRCDEVLKNPNEFNIDKFYEKYRSGPKIFKKRDALEPSFIPDELPHREKDSIQYRIEE